MRHLTLSQRLNSTKQLRAERIVELWHSELELGRSAGLLTECQSSFSAASRRSSVVASQAVNMAGNTHYVKSWFGRIRPQRNGGCLYTVVCVRLREFGCKGDLAHDL